MTAHHRLPAGYRHLPTRATAASLRGIRAALAALADERPGPAGEEALALREQLHRDALAAEQRQGALPLRRQA